MNIAFCTPAALRNNKESAYLTSIVLAKALQKKGHTVTLIARGGKNLPPFEKKSGVELYRVKNSGFLQSKSSFFFTPGYASAISAFQKEKNLAFDVIHGFSATPWFALPLLRAKKHTPQAKYIFTLKSYSRYKLANSGYFLLQLFHQNTVPTATFAQKLWSVTKEKLHLVSSPIDVDKFYPKEKRDLKKKYGYQRKKVILYYGALWKEKGVKILLESIAAIVQKFPESIFLFLPRYQPSEDFLQRIEKLGLQKNVEVIYGEVPIEDYVNLADLVVLPYLSLAGTEGNPSCMLEAMACKTTVLTSDLPELKEIAGECVFFAQPGSVKDLQEKILSAFCNKNPQMKEKAYLKAQEFAAEKIAEKFLEVYRK